MLNVAWGMLSEGFPNKFKKCLDIKLYCDVILEMGRMEEAAAAKFIYIWFCVFTRFHT